ncbi:serotonin N-acetyltransferase 2, chloroplastic [Brachypodium distachyon]|uniref:N-acetyltransferase domain-containing protein n=1 Tax=Brachypodium distachyon TaxID=15368 RepID=I1I090_BRADI|nr:serotonin N-acetyltransferase 2, chloroplastic [Brachypodium distachyon]KQJ94756.1 hypothetical protein BRADI_3g12980v3 [Brachypodium distachyon]|eukprot:XP_003571288.1 serotonin N-acetyltransferase 2, chloroplastic [Brachypodium distachyon]
MLHLAPKLQPRPRGCVFFLGAGKPMACRTNPYSFLPPASSFVPNSGGVQLTVSDAELSARGFTARRTAEGLDVAALNEVFARVGFPRRQEARLRRALAHSEVAWVASAATGRPLAFARAAGDGVFNAVVWDVVVEPSCQGLGLGRAVMERLVAGLRLKGVGNIVLYAEPRVVGFYRPLGFAMDPDGIRGMAYYKSRQQNQTTNTTSE